MQAQLVRLAPNQIGRQLIVRNKDEEESSHRRQCNGRNVNPARRRGGEQRACQLCEVCLPPYRPGPPLHYHVDFIETFTEKQGQLDIHVDRDQKYLLLLPGTVRPRRSGSHIDLPTITMSR
jgi:hypothetical protein